MAGASALASFLVMDVIEGKGIFPKQVTDSPLLHASVLSGIGMLGGAAIYKHSPAAGLGVAGGVCGLAGFIGLQGMTAASKQQQPALNISAIDPLPPQGQAPAASGTLAAMGAIRSRRMPSIGAIDRAYDMARVGRIVYSDFRSVA